MPGFIGVGAHRLVPADPSDSGDGEGGGGGPPEGNEACDAWYADPINAGRVYPPSCEAYLTDLYGPAEAPHACPVGFVPILLWGPNYCINPGVYLYNQAYGYGWCYTLDTPNPGDS